MTKKQIVELNTDQFGRVKKQKDQFQIKVWEYKVKKGPPETKELELVGTITFNQFKYDFTYVGVVNKKNSKMILDNWFYTGMSHYLIEKVNGDVVVKFPMMKYYGQTQTVENQKKFVRDCPEYKDFRLVKITK